MKRRIFLVPTLIAAGFTIQDKAIAAHPSTAPLAGADPNKGTLLRLFKQDHAVILADHRSHSSHSSHRSSSGGGGSGHYSHTSHRSSTAGPYSYPAPIYQAPSSPSPDPPREIQGPSALVGGYNQNQTTATQYATPTAQARTISGRTNQFKAIVRRVQIALMARDLYSGGIDGSVGPALRGAIRKFQAANSLTVTGTITPEVLDGLRVSSSE